MSADVILLKAPLQDQQHPYRELFESSGYVVGFVPVLEAAWIGQVEKPIVGRAKLGKLSYRV
jgi:hypothetical protein